MATPNSTELINETEVRNYFIQHGGIVRNNDIVTYFRAYLANPVIRDEARALFKSIVNKLATVKVENGEKYLVLKRQYFPPIDGNGNNDAAGSGGLSLGSQQQISSSYGRPVVLPPTTKTTNPRIPLSNTTSSTGSSTYPYQTQDYEYNQNLQSQQKHSAPVTSTNPYNFNPYSYQVPPPYVAPSSANYIPQQLQQGGQGQYYQTQYQQQQSPSQLLSKSQPSLYGSNFSLISNSNVAIPPYPHPSISQITNNAYLNAANYSQQQSPSSSVLFNNNENYPAEYGLPTMTTPPRRLSFTASSSSLASLGLPYGQQHERQGGVAGRTPPPYRPPPSALIGSPNTLPSSTMPGGFRMISSSVAPGNSTNYHRSPPPTNLAFQAPKQSNQYGFESGSVGHAQHQYQRSLSGPGNVTSPVGGAKNSAQSSSSNNQATVAFLQAATTTASSPVFGVSTLPGEGTPPIPPRFKRGSSSSNSPNSEGNIARFAPPPTMSSEQEAPAFSRAYTESGMEKENDINFDKENANPNNVPRSRSSSLPNGSDIDDGNGSICSNPNGNGVSDEMSEESEQKISVKERMQKFNRIASESELGKLKNSNNANKNGGKHYVQDDDDTTSLSSYGYGYANTEPRAREWILKAATCDYHGINKLGIEIPSLVKRKDVNYTALHWAAKHGHVELIKLLAGTFKSDVNSKTNGGYTPLALSAQFSRHEAYELLIKVYNADPNIRDHSGRKPMQYLVRQDTTVSVDTFKKIKEKRRSTESQRDRDSSFLRIGSLNVRVKRTTEAFGNFLGKSNSSTSIERMSNKSWGSADNLQESFDNNPELGKDKEMMPPPHGNVVLRGSVSSSTKEKHRRSRRSLQSNDSTPSLSKLHQMSSSDSEESDTACGFGSHWKT